MIVTVVSGSIVADITYFSVSRTFDGNTPPRPLVETYKDKAGNTVATVTKTYTSSGASLVPTTEVRT